MVLDEVSPVAGLLIAAGTGGLGVLVLLYPRGLSQFYVWMADRLNHSETARHRVERIGLFTQRAAGVLLLVIGLLTLVATIITLIEE